MRIVSLLFALSWAIGSAATGIGADLTKLERIIAKEPAYKNKPKYCLVVFGPEAKTRVWLALDGDVLYVDKNGNGDLTEANERIQEDRPTPNFTTFLAGNVRLDYETSLTDFNLTIPKRAAGTPDLDITFHGKRASSVRSAYARVREFSERPQDAPVVHFEGPLTFLLPDPPTLLRGQKRNLFVYVGTAGLGRGAFAWRPAGALVAADVKVVVQIEYSSQNPSGKLLLERTTLSLDDCCGSYFRGTVQVPSEAGLGKAKITLSLDSKEKSVAPATFGVLIADPKDKDLLQGKGDSRN
jgi:hypothetical protein